MTKTTAWAARPTYWNGTLMRSRMEAAFASWADSEGLGPEYEPAAFAGGEGGQYLPDFLLRYVHVHGLPLGDPYDGTLWVECKPLLPTGAELVALQARVEVVQATLPDAVLAIAYKDPTPSLLVKLGACIWRPACWTRAPRPYNVGVAFPLGREMQPWPTGYWEGPAT